MEAPPLELPDKKPSYELDFTGVPAYYNLKEVFIKMCATSLPPHRPYDCGINLLPGTTPCRGRLFAHSATEKEAMQMLFTFTF